jgi:hypothetical protein
VSSEAQEPVQAPGESVVRRGGRDPGRPGEKARRPWHVRSALVTVFRDLCVARSGAGSRNTFTWSRLGRAVGATRDLNAQPYGPLSHYVTMHYYPADTGRGRSAGPGPRSYARAAATRATAARSRRRALEAGSGRPRGRHARSVPLARATGELQLAIAPELLASLLALYATNRYEHIICC